LQAAKHDPSIKVQSNVFLFISFPCQPMAKNTTLETSTVRRWLQFRVRTCP